MRLRSLLGLVCLSISGSAIAIDAPVGNTIARLAQVMVEIPPGFTGPQRTFPNEQTELDTYVEIVSAGRAPTIIQLTHIVVPNAAADLSEHDRYRAAANFLDGFLAIFGQKVTRWSRSPNEKIRFDGFLGARARWTGNLNGFPSTGVMYFLVLGKDSFVFHAFGSRAEPNASLKASIRAIEGLRLGAANSSLERTRKR
jgi:hypothetical protein